MVYLGSGPPSANNRWPLGGYAALPPGEGYSILEKLAGGHGRLVRRLTPAARRPRRPTRTLGAIGDWCGGHRELGRERHACAGSSCSRVDRQYRPDNQEELLASAESSSA
jgi:hypothetical protein